MGALVTNERAARFVQIAVDVFVIVFGVLEQEPHAVDRLILQEGAHPARVHEHILRAHANRFHLRGRVTQLGRGINFQRKAAAAFFFGEFSHLV